MPTTVSDLRSQAQAALAEAGVPTPDADAELLIGHVLGMSRGQVQAATVTDAAVADDLAARVLELVARRSAREPLQHLTGRAAFRALELHVGPGVFVPRPETELTAQLAIDALLAVPVPSPIAVDLGTGSGAIALALATEVPHARVVAVERSPDALAWARRNTEGVANLTLVHGDLADALPEMDGTVDVVVSNPPYIPDDSVPVDPEVRLHDPAEALYGGADGLDAVRALSKRAGLLLRPGGTLVLEHGERQGSAIRALLAADAWRAPATHPDLLARPRVTTATTP
ncbi:MAG: peptide chain release factor N(5)-glutamine methyltransferase [Microbacteriaceae bacterium]|nr:peptide chain release factor N(5)-glutamine methyltransferase [Microbacteriaceae bacterium]